MFFTKFIVRFLNAQRFKEKQKPWPQGSKDFFKSKMPLRCQKMFEFSQTEKLWYPFAGISMTWWRFSCENFLQPLSYQKSKWIYLLVKLRYSKKATKFAKNLFDIVEDFFRILLPTQNIWTLMIFLFVKNGLVIAQKKTFNQKCMQKIPKPDSHYCLLVCQVRYRTPSHELSNKKGGNGSVFFYDNIYWR